MNQRDRIQLHVDWWRRRNRRLLAAPYAPVAVPFGGLDVDVPASQLAERKRRNAEALAAVPADTLNVACVNFGPAFIPALAGAGFAHDRHTSWSLPAVDALRKLRIKRFDPGCPLFSRYAARLEALLGAWSWETFLPGLADYLGPLDVLAALVGPEVLSLALYDDPEEVRRQARAAAVFVREVLDHETALHRSAGVVGGVTDAFSLWLPGRGARLSEDFSALTGAGHFRDFFVEADSLLCDGLDSVALHVHSAACASMGEIVQIRGLGAVELGNDPNGPDIETRVAAARLVQARGQALQMSSWNVAMPERDLQYLLDQLEPEGLLVRTQTASLAEAEVVYARLTTRKPR